MVQNVTTHHLTRLACLYVRQSTTPTYFCVVTAMRTG